MEYLNSCPLCSSKNLSKYLITKDFFNTQDSFDIVHCNTCQVKFTHPQPDDTELISYYNSPNYLSHNRNNTIFSFIYSIVQKLMFHYKFKIIQNLITNGLLLDIGCGRGDFLNFLYKKGIQGYGIESNVKARNFAIKEYNLQVYDFSEFSKNINYEFDIITFWHSFEHLRNPIDYIKFSYRSLKINGYLLIALPNYESYDANFYKEFWAGWDVPRHLFHYNYKRLISLLNEYSFQLQFITYLFFDPFYISYLSESYKRSSFSIFKALKRGLLTSFYTNKNIHQASSLLYIFKKY